MAETTGIAWTDRTHNEWWGCSSKAGEGCRHCYAAELDASTGGNYFTGVTPRLTSVQNRNKPYRWEKEAVLAEKPLRVFCGSMMDFFDKKVPVDWRENLFSKIKATPHLRWQILTKRPGNIPKMLPADWKEGYENVWLGTTVEDKKSGLKRLRQLQAMPAALRFLSIEPLLEDLGDLDLTGIDWVIIGGESGPYARPMRKEWVDNIVRQCATKGIPVFFKQWGGKDADAGGCVYEGRILQELPVF